MTQTSPIRHALEDIIEKLTTSSDVIEAFPISEGHNHAVRLECRAGEVEVALDVFVLIAGDGSSYHLDQYLTADSRFDLMSHGLLPAGRFEALELGGWLASQLAAAHRGRIIETARRACAA